MENVSRAALKLHVSQPALSRQIRDLEDEIGFCLLERTAKSVRLTEAGRAFLNDARELLRQADEAVKKARAIASEEPTELHIGYSPAPFAEVLPKILRAFQRAMPNVHVRLHDWNNKTILTVFHKLRYPAIISRKIDGAIHGSGHTTGAGGFAWHARIIQPTIRTLFQPS